MGRSAGPVEDLRRVGAIAKFKDFFSSSPARSDEEGRCSFAFPERIGNIERDIGFAEANQRNLGRLEIELAKMPELVF